MTEVPDHRELEQVILGLLEERGPGMTICPSDAARRFAAPGDRGGWRVWMRPVREAAARLIAAGEIVATQRGRTVEIATAKGPIRLRRR